MSVVWPHIIIDLCKCIGSVHIIYEYISDYHTCKSFGQKSFVGLCKCIGPSGRGGIELTLREENSRKKEREKKKKEKKEKGKREREKGKKKGKRGKKGKKGRKNNIKRR